MGGGKSGSTTQSSTVSIPPEVLARYNAVNSRAENTAAQPFQPFSGEFVAPLNSTQQAAISNISQAQGIGGPFYDAAANSVVQGANQAMPYYGGATQALVGAASEAMPFFGAAQDSLYGGAAAAAPHQMMAAGNIMGAQAGAQPYQAMATGLGLAGTAAVNPGGLSGQDIDRYMSPYVQRVADSTFANLREQQGQEQQDLLSKQIMAGGFGGDRGQIARANLARQHDLATAQAMSGIYNQGYGQALSTAQQQQTEQLQADQANRAALQAGASQMAGLGQQGFQQGITTAQQQAALGQQLFGQGATGAQQMAGLGQNVYNVGAGVSQGLAGFGQGVYGIGSGAGQNLANIGSAAQQGALQGAQAQLAAGTVAQQTQQAQNQADYNQFLQQQGYPFQIAQFLANIAMGTGALSGSSTNATTTSPQSFFSDERLKHDVEPIGKTFDGQDIVRFKYNGQPGTRIGLIAQDVEQHHPRAVGLAGGYKTVDYDTATDEAAKRGHFAYGGGLAAGGTPDISDALNQLLTAHQGMYPYGKSGLYGRTSERGGPYGTTMSPAAARGLMRAELAPPPRQESGLAGMNNVINTGRNLGSAYTGTSKILLGSEGTDKNPEGSRGLIGRGGDLKPSEGWVAANLGRDSANPARNPVNPPLEDTVQNLPPPDMGARFGDYRGGLVRGYALGGTPYGDADGYVPEDDKFDLKKLKEQFDGMSKGSGLAKPGDSGPGLLGGLAQIGSAASGIGALGKGLGSVLSLLALRDGGVARHGYALDGSVEEPVEGGADAVPVANDNPARPRDADNDVYRQGVLKALAGSKREEPNWMQRNKDWVVPILTGLGTMAASPSRYAGAAMLQGLGAGAGQYAAMQERGIEQERQGEQTNVAKAQALIGQQREANQERQLQEQMFQNTMRMFGTQNPDGRYTNPFGGPATLSPQEAHAYAYQVAYGRTRPPPGALGAPAEGGAAPAGGLMPPAPPAAGQTPGGASPPAQSVPQAGAPPAGAAPAGAAPPSPQSQQAEQSPQPQGLPRFLPEYDPVLLRQQAQTARNSGNEAQANLLRDKATDIEQGRITPFTVDRQPYYGFKEKAELHKQATERVAKESETANQFQQQYEDNQKTLNDLAAIRQSVDLGRFSSYRSTISSIARQLGIQGEELNKIETAAAGTDKMAIRQAFETMSQYAQRAPAAGLREALMTVANSEMPPGGAYQILTREVARNARQHDYYNDWATGGFKDPMTFRREWERKNPLDKYLQQAVDSMPYFQGMSPGDRQALPVLRSDDPLREERLRQRSGAPPRVREADVGGRKIVVRNGRWVYEDTGEQYVPSGPQGGGQ